MWGCPRLWAYIGGSPYPDLTKRAAIPLCLEGRFRRSSRLQHCLFFLLLLALSCYLYCLPLRLFFPPNKRLESDDRGAPGDAPELVMVGEAELKCAGLWWGLTSYHDRVQAGKRGRLLRHRRGTWQVTWGCSKRQLLGYEKAYYGGNLAVNKCSLQ